MDIGVSENSRNGTRDAPRYVAKREGNGAIVCPLSSGRPLCDGGHAVMARKDTALLGTPTELPERAHKARQAGSSQTAAERGSQANVEVRNAMARAIG
jgi:CDGSH-type Zn-finger protein